MLPETLAKREAKLFTGDADRILVNNFPLFYCYGYCFHSQPQIDQAYPTKRNFEPKSNGYLRQFGKDLSCR
jgi:hypothetical protein